MRRRNSTRKPKAPPSASSAESFGFKSDHWYSPGDVAERLDVHRSTVSRWIGSGRISAQQVGGRNLRIQGSEIAKVFAPVGKKALEESGLL